MRALTECSRVFATLPIAADGGGGSGGGSGGASVPTLHTDRADLSPHHARLIRVCASWDKFVALADLLEYRLGEIADQLPRYYFIHLVHVLSILFYIDYELGESSGRSRDQSDVD